jgi:uncharacterized circularly permuted ATP-grasp superfamily protein
MPQKPFDEMSPNGQVRPPYALFADWLERQGGEILARRHRQADMLFRRIGITFAVYGDSSGAA